jgi:hypothetical protein
MTHTVLKPQEVEEQDDNEEEEEKQEEKQEENGDDDNRMVLQTQAQRSPRTRQPAVTPGRSPVCARTSPATAIVASHRARVCACVRRERL